MSAATSPGPRERLLAAGQQLFYSHGVSVGVDALLQESSVARRSLYEHFGGKAGLICAVLHRAAEEDLQWYEAALDAATDPRDRLLGLFDQLDDLVADPGFRGCRYFATDLFLVDPDHPAHAESVSFRRRLRGLLVRELEAVDHPRPEWAAERLHLLIEGTLVMGAAHDTDRPGHVARDLARTVLDASPRR